MKVTPRQAISFKAWNTQWPQHRSEHTRIYYRIEKSYFHYFSIRLLTSSLFYIFVFPVLNHKVNVTIFLLACMGICQPILYFIYRYYKYLYLIYCLKLSWPHQKATLIIWSNKLLHVWISSILLPTVQPETMLIRLKSPSRCSL